MQTQDEDTYEHMLARYGGVPDRYTEKWRPRFHFSPPEGWINDPNGLVYYDGEYHLFHQHRHPLLPDGMNWGHAVSADLVHWEHLPVALTVDELGQIFSGSAVVDHDNTTGFFEGGSGLVAIFTHHGEVEQQSIAFSRDRGRTWTTYKGNPVIPNVGDKDFRDPKVFWHHPTGRWIMVVAGGKVRFYSSANLRDWTFESINEDIETECPDFFELPVDGDPGNTRWVLNRAGRSYMIGKFDGRVFMPETEAIPLNGGPDFYAAQTFNDIPAQDGRRIMINWMASWAYAGNVPTKSWQGAMTLPYELRLRTFPEGMRLVQTPVEELKSLRGAGQRWEDVTVSPGTNPLAGVSGTTLEIVVEFELGTASAFGLKVRKGDSRQTTVGYDVAAGELFVDRTAAGDAGIDGFGQVFAAPLPPEDDRVKMHVFVDACSVEVFGNDGRAVITALIFPEPESNAVELYAEGGEVRVNSLEVYELSSIWK